MIEIADKWIKSSFCADHHCVEVAKEGDHVVLRDGKNINQPHLRFSSEDWRRFLDEINEGRLQLV